MSDIKKMSEAGSICSPVFREKRKKKTATPTHFMIHWHWTEMPSIECNNKR